MLTRRQLLERGVLGATAALWPIPSGAASRGLWVNDVHSRLNRTRVRGVQRPTSIDDLQARVRQAARDGARLSIAGGRHAMGGQQFGTNSWLLDLNGLDEVHEFDRERGEIEVGAGIQWPKLVSHLLEVQQGTAQSWGIAQKQTGADRLSLGGALAANAHGRGLAMRPIVGDVEAFTLVDPSGGLHRCSRSENAELFRLAIGGYGLFGPMASVRLRLTPRRRLERVVELVELADLPRRFEERRAAGYLYGDFQFETALDRESALRRGVFSCYRPVAAAPATPAPHRKLSEDDWRELVLLAHVDPGRAFDEYAAYYLQTSGQTYWSDTHQMSTYVDDYHHQLADRLGPLARGSEMISELYVPRDALGPFMEAVRRDLRDHDARLIYGTIRLIERDEESLLTWAREPWACVIFNLHTGHDRASLARTAADFRRLIDRAAHFGGSYFLTYHRWAGRQQVRACHPRFAEFLREKRLWDPEERFTSDWYVHHRSLLGEAS